MNKFEIRQSGNRVILVNPNDLYPPKALAEFWYEVDDKGMPTVHLTVNPGCHMGQLFVDGQHYKLARID